MAGFHIKDYLRETSVIQSRLLVAIFVSLLLALVLFFRLYHLQVNQNQHFVTLSQSNRIELVPVPPVRGDIYDRNGKVLAQNFSVFNLEVSPDQIKDMDGMLDQLSQLVTLTDRDLKRFGRLLKARPSFERQTLRTNLSPEETARFSVNQHRFPGVELQARLQRTYPKRDLTAHILGYVGRISAKDLDRMSEEDHTAYRGTDYIGKLGIESYYERELLGEVGYEQVEMNAHGRVVRELSRTPPISGRNLTLTIDSALQEAAARALQSYRGALVAMEPATGEVLAFVSVPGYDSNLFVNGIDEGSYQALSQSPDKPLLNRALDGQYAPGSTIKGFMALAGMAGNIEPRQTVMCPGWYSLPNHKHKYRCWKKTGHGKVDMHSSVVQSCDVYFYRMSKTLGIDFIHDQFELFGFNKKTGIDLHGEKSGLVPSREWKRRTKDEVWYPGETIIAGIGQGYMLATPLQLAQGAALLANRGRLVSPRFLSDPESVSGSAELKSRISNLGATANGLVEPYMYDNVIAAMRDVVHGKKGTARKLAENIDYEIAGKTGTAQVIAIAQDEKYEEDKIAKRFRDHSLFIAFAPVDNPQIAIAVVAENGGSGSSTAAPIAGKVMDFYLKRIGLSQERSIVGL